MRDILMTCATVDRTAGRMYRDIAKRCEDAGVSALLTRQSDDMREAHEWLLGLLTAHEAGLVPDLVADTDAAGRRAHEALAVIGSAAPGDAPLSAGEALGAAAAIELLLADPVFVELFDLAGGVGADVRYERYAHHVRRLTAAIEERGAGGLERLVGLQLDRAARSCVETARESTRDPLTGMGNRRWLEAHLRRWSAWSARRGRPYALLLIDLDLFREVNGRHGRAAGDEVLVAVGRAVTASVRASDAPARLGSDEFAVLAPDTSPDEARAMAARIAERVRGALVATEAGIVAPTASQGIAVVWDAPDAEPRTPDEVIGAAARALYAAKCAGRDRVADPVVLAASVPV